MKNQQSKKQRVIVERNNQDYISTLPYSLLCNILSSLKINEAVKTSVLSSNWRYIFTNPTNLIFDAENMLVKDYSFHNLSKVLIFNIKIKRASTFISNVNKYLLLVKNVKKIDKLKVCFTFRNKGYGCNDLNEWIRFANERNVEEIDLCLLEENNLSAPNDGSFYVFPCDTFDFNSILKCLRLAHCVLAPQKSFSGFCTLATLELFKVDLKSEEHIRNLLSSCDNLESLNFSECINMDYLKIDQSLCKKLKYLKVNLCRQLKAIILKSNNLVTLEYVGSKVDFIFDTPNLTTFYGLVGESVAYHDENWLVCKLSTDLPQLENLFLECCCIGEVMRNRIPKFQNLRRLEVIKVAIFKQDLSWIPVALNACPALAKLKLHLRTYFNIDEELTYWPPRSPHNHLKEITITGIRGHSSEIAIAIYLLKNAISLEKMIVDPRPRIYLGNGKCVYSEGCENWSMIVRHKVEFLLKQEISSSVELSIL